MTLYFATKQSNEEHFWKWFESHSDEYYNYPKEKEEILFDQIGLELMKINKDLTFEFGPTDAQGKREFIISAGGIRSAFPSVISLAKKAPKLKKWKVIAFRPRLRGYGINYGTVKLTELDIFFTYEKDGDKIGITLFIKGYQKQTDYDMATYLLLDSVVGEYDVETQIGFIERRKFDENDKDHILPITELPKIVDENKSKNKA